MNSINPNPIRIAYDYDFVCTYQMIDDDEDMSNFLYQIQLTTAFFMQKNTDANPNPSGIFDYNCIQDVFDYLVNVMHLYKNKKFVSIMRKHPIISSISTDQAASCSERRSEGETDADVGADAGADAGAKQFNKYNHDDLNDKKLVEDGLMWLISFHSFHAFHKCMIDIITNNDAQLISFDSLDALEKSFREI